MKTPRHPVIEFSLRFAPRLALSLVVTGALFGGAAQARSSCAAIQASKVDLILGARKPTELEAFAIVGDFPPPEQLRRALNHVAQVSNANFKVRAETLRSLLIAIQESNFRTWNFLQFRTADGGLGFVGEQGYFVLATPDGRLRKGIMDTNREIGNDGIWRGGSEESRDLTIDPGF